MAEPLKEGDNLPDTLHQWTDAESGEKWTLVLAWRVLRGRAECVSVEFSSIWGPRARGHPVSSRVLRTPAVARLIDEHRAGLSDWLPPEQARTYSVPAGMRASTWERLQEAAAVYRADTTGRPTKAVARHFTLSDSAAGKVVGRARVAGLLPPTTPGVAAAKATKPPRKPKGTS